MNSNSEALVRYWLSCEPDSVIASGWVDRGKVTKESLQVEITFREKYGGSQKDKNQDMGTNNIVEIILE